MKYLSLIFAGAGLALGFTEVAQAASLLPADAMANLGTDTKDTIVEINSYAIPAAIGTTVAFGALAWSKRGTKKAIN